MGGVSAEAAAAAAHGGDCARWGGEGGEGGSGQRDGSAGAKQGAASRSPIGWQSWAADDAATRALRPLFVAGSPVAAAVDALLVALRRHSSSNNSDGEAGERRGADEAPLHDHTAGVAGSSAGDADDGALLRASLHALRMPLVRDAAYWFGQDR